MLIGVTNVHRQTNIHPQGKCSPVGHMFIGRTIAQGYARQYRYEPPSEFPQTSPYTRIVHHLSGPNRCAHTQTSLNRSVGCWCKYPSSHFHCASRFNHPGTCTYARLLGPCFKKGQVKPICHHMHVKGYNREHTNPMCETW